MWTEITRRQYERKGLRYASDLTDAEWERIAPTCRHPPRSTVHRYFSAWRDDGPVSAHQPPSPAGGARGAGTRLCYYRIVIGL